MPGLNNLATAFNPARWSKKILTRLDRKNVMLASGAVNRDYEGDIKQAGDTVWVRTYGDVTVGPYTRGTGINYSGLTPVKQSLVVNDAQYFAFNVDDLDQAQNDLNALDGYTDRAAVAMGYVVENKCLSKYGLAPTANQVGVGAVITVSTANAYTNIVEAGKRLDVQNVDPEGRWLVVGPNYKSVLLKDTTFFIRATDLADTLIRTGRLNPGKGKDLPNFLGQVAGFNVFWSNTLPGDLGGQYCQFGGPGVISYAGQIRSLEKIRLQDTFGDAVRGLILHDNTVFDEHAKAFGTIYVTAA